MLNNSFLSRQGGLQPSQCWHKAVGPAQHAVRCQPSRRSLVFHQQAAILQSHDGSLMGTVLTGQVGEVVAQYEVSPSPLGGQLHDQLPESSSSCKPCLIFSSNHPPSKASCSTLC